MPTHFRIARPLDLAVLFVKRIVQRRLLDSLPGFLDQYRSSVARRYANVFGFVDRLAVHTSSHWRWFGMSVGDLVEVFVLEEKQITVPVNVVNIKILSFSAYLLDSYTV
jgi:hypothetical protein